MHPLDMLLLFAIANVVAWPVSLFVDDDLRHILGHMFVCTLGALIGSFLALRLFPDSSKFVLIFGGFIGAGILQFLVRFKKWKRG